MLRTSATTCDVGLLSPAHTRSASSSTSGAPVPLPSVLTSLAGGWWYFRCSFPVWCGRTWQSLASGARDSPRRVRGRLGLGAGVQRTSPSPALASSPTGSVCLLVLLPLLRLPSAGVLRLPSAARLCSLSIPRGHLLPPLSEGVLRLGMLELRQTFTLSRGEGRAGGRADAAPTRGGGGGGGFVAVSRSAPARACLGERSQNEGGASVLLENL